ncbi:hypothetical protein [Salinarchaeum laminariae]|uniref:hypothetical protein n=1 Tax=Salinarchaeum laminariae TaxID=869888 RepID=UPI0020C13BEF|nr:hypothetical protein [Salinarchaeum laminariae]
MSELSRQRMLGAASALAALGALGPAAQAQEAEPSVPDDQLAYYTVTAESATQTVTSDTDEDVQVAGGRYVTEGVDIDGDGVVGAK